jgi:TnpA family transposase
MTTDTQQNTLIATDTKRGFELSTPLPDYGYIKQFQKLFPKRNSVSLVDVFETINSTTGFLDRFDHFEIVYPLCDENVCDHDKPDPIYFYGSLIDRCKRKGLKKAALKLGNLNETILKDTSREYFLKENLVSAIACVTEFIESHALSTLPESGLNPYWFDDTTGSLEKSTVICCSEMEFPYVIDILTGNKTAPLESDYFELKDPVATREFIFGVADLFGYTYAMRINDFSTIPLYGADNSIKGVLSPDTPVDMSLVENNWDDMLRFIATIHTKYTPATIIMPKIMNRLDDSIFQGIRELGKINQTMFMLNYIDNLELRQAIESHLTKADIYKNQSALIQKPLGKTEYIPHDDRILNDACKTLTERCITAWNYLHLSDIIESSSNREEIKSIIKHGYVPHWKHVDTII